MDGLGCPRCSERDLRIAELERRLAELEARLKTNSSNSSTPRSANPPGADKPVKKKKSRGGQPKHPPHLKQLLPPERVTRTEHFVPGECAHCHAPLSATAGPDDPEPKRFQTIELPPITVQVT